MHTNYTELVQLEHSILDEPRLSLSAWLWIVLHDDVYGIVAEHSLGGYLTAWDVG
jgi:hypothetical protein